MLRAEAGLIEGTVGQRTGADDTHINGYVRCHLAEGGIVDEK